jgi:hypothetical protein
VLTGDLAEHGNLLWVQNAEDINANSGGMYCYRCVVIVKFSRESDC